jgi:hypothetical protein
MRKVTRAVSAFLIATGIALSPMTAFAADDDEGTIATVDREGLTITLDNGNTYKLSGEFDVESLQEGVDVVLAYDTIGGVKTVTDLIVYE